jgi:hypothetical protein
MIVGLLLQLSRTYWLATVPQLASGTFRHTHVAVTGIVAYTRIEDDGDLHIRLVADSGAVFVIAECIPRLPCRRPRIGERITVKGIQRFDPEHAWREVHPVEELSP